MLTFHILLFGRRLDSYKKDLPKHLVAIFIIINIIIYMYVHTHIYNSIRLNRHRMLW